jgi:1,4-alpha-glucan branching enzyme
MKKIIFSLLVFLFSLSIFSQQLVTTTPTFIAQNFAGEVEVIFDATQGNAALVGSATCYAHTGVILTSGPGWKKAPVWLDNAPKYQLTSIGTDLWKLTIPSLSSYYNLAEGEVIAQLAFVFRNADGTKQGKTAAGSDIFIDLYDPSVLSLSVLNPAADAVIEKDASFVIQANVSMSATIELFINDELVKTEEAATSISYDFDTSIAGDYTLKIKATSGEATAETIREVCIKSPVQYVPVPTGMLEGINYNAQNNSVTLVLRAPLKENVFVIGDFNDWKIKNNYQMFRNEENGMLWWLTIENLNPDTEYAFQYLIDGNLKVSDAYTEKVIDPWNDKYIPVSVHPRLTYPAKADGLVSVFQINRPQYQWEVTDFVAPAKEDLIIYELLIRDFTTEGTIKAAMNKLDYLQNLGINAIELMPIQEFDGNDSWGYNPNHFFAYDKAYGTREDYKRFIDECHKRGIAVFVDKVFNHATGVNPFAKMYWAGNATAADNPWFNVVEKHPFNVFHDINHEYEGTRQFFKRVLKYWIEEYKVDGYRMDLSKGFTQKNSLGDVGKWGRKDDTRINIIKDYHQAVKETNPNAVFILEHFADYDEEQILANDGMLLWRNMNHNYGQAAMGYSSNSNFVDSNGKGAMFTNSWVGFAESHDEERMGYRMLAWGSGDLKTNEEARLKRVPLIMAFVTLIPGPKMMWQFKEMGYEFSIDQNGRTGRKPIPWAAFNASQAKQDAYEASAKIVSLRTNYPQVFKEDNVTVQATVSNWSNGRKIIAQHPDLHVVAIGNFDATATITATPGFTKTGLWYELLTGNILDVKNLNRTISLTPGELVVYTDRLPINVAETLQDDPISYVYPTIATDYIYVSSLQEIIQVNIYNMQGVLVKSQTNTEIAVNNLHSGYYIVQVVLDNGISTHKINKQ